MREIECNNLLAVDKCPDSDPECCNFPWIKERNHHHVMCMLCDDRYRPYGLNSESKGDCVANEYPQQCFEHIPYDHTDFLVCPTSQYRNNKCIYNFNNTWVEKGPGEASPIPGCSSYKICTEDLKDEISDLQENEKPTDTYHIMCEACHADTHWEKNKNDSGKGACPAKAMPTFCALGDGPPDGYRPPVDPETVIIRETWIEHFMR